MERLRRTVDRMGMRRSGQRGKGRYANPNVVKDIKKIIRKLKLGIDVDEFPPPDLDWDEACWIKPLSEDFIREFADKVDWFRVSAWQPLSEDFIREFADKVDWEEISQRQELSEDFMREFADYVIWEDISFYQDLSEDFIREFQDDIDWHWIDSRGSDLSDEFVEEFSEYLPKQRQRVERNTGKTLRTWDERRKR